MAKEVIEEVNKLESLKKIDFTIGTKKNKINRILYIIRYILFYVFYYRLELLTMRIFSILIRYKKDISFTESIFQRLLTKYFNDCFFHL